MRYAFGLFELDSETLVLRSKGEPVPITHKALHTLRILVENAGRVVSKDEILRSVWAGVSVEEANLTQNIYALRRILGEKPQDHRFIVTVPGVGYGFVAEVRACHSATRGNPAPLLNGDRPEPSPPELPTMVVASEASKRMPASDPADTGRRRFGIYQSGLALGAVLLLGGAGYVTLQRTANPPLYTSTPFTSYRGSQLGPSFAPDGERVAFAWDSEEEGNFDIYVKRMGSESLLRLTSSPEPEVSPTWSPDGRSIAFSRYSDREIIPIQAEALAASPRLLR